MQAAHTYPLVQWGSSDSRPALRASGHPPPGAPGNGPCRLVSMPPARHGGCDSARVVVAWAPARRAAERGSPGRGLAWRGKDGPPGLGKLPAPADRSQIPAAGRPPFPSPSPLLSPQTPTPSYEVRELQSPSRGPRVRGDESLSARGRDTGGGSMTLADRIWDGRGVAAAVQWTPRRGGCECGERAVRRVGRGSGCDRSLGGPGRRGEQRSTRRAWIAGLGIDLAEPRERKAWYVAMM